MLFYLLIPFLNKLIHALTQREHFLLMAWGLDVYVVLPSFAKAEVTFNYITWFGILYIIAAYLRLYPQQWFENSRVTGVSLFLFFRSLKLGYSKTINTVAASTFGVLLIHANSDTMRRWLWRDVCNNVGAYDNGKIVIHAIVCVVTIYTVCTLIDMGRIWLLKQISFKRDSRFAQ